MIIKKEHSGHYKFYRKHSLMYLKKNILYYVQKCLKVFAPAISTFFFPSKYDPLITSWSGISPGHGSEIKTSQTEIISCFQTEDSSSYTLLPRTRSTELCWRWEELHCLHLLASSVKTDTFFAFQTCIQSMNATEQLRHFAKSAQKRKVASEDISNSCQETL